MGNDDAPPAEEKEKKTEAGGCCLVVVVVAFVITAVVCFTNVPQDKNFIATETIGTELLTVECFGDQSLEGDVFDDFCAEHAPSSAERITWLVLGILTSAAAVALVVLAIILFRKGRLSNS